MPFGRLSTRTKNAAPARTRRVPRKPCSTKPSSRSSSFPGCTASRRNPRTPLLAIGPLDSAPSSIGWSAVRSSPGSRRPTETLSLGSEVEGTSKAPAEPYLRLPVIRRCLRPEMDSVDWGYETVSLAAGLCRPASDSQATNLSGSGDWPPTGASVACQATDGAGKRLDPSLGQDSSPPRRRRTTRHGNRRAASIVAPERPVLSSRFGRNPGRGIPAPVEWNSYHEGE